MPAKDIETREDVVLLVNRFYEQVRVNPVLGYIFEELAQVNWDEHLPKMYSFWASILLHEQSYSGNPMIRHLELSQKVPLREQEFSEWLKIFNQTVDAHFQGENAEEAKLRAGNIARLMLYKIQKNTNSGDYIFPF